MYLYPLTWNIIYSMISICRSMLFFVVCILLFVWCTGSVADSQQRVLLSPNGALGTRIAITAVFTLGMFFLVMIVRTLKRYGGHEESSYLSMGMAPGNNRSNTRASVRADDIYRDTTTERRGREREWGALGRMREETLKGSNTKVTDGDVLGREKNGLKAMLALGHSEQGMKDLDLGIEVDLEKGNETESMSLSKNSQPMTC